MKSVQDLKDKKSAYIELGKIVKAHGMKGELKVLPFSGEASDLTIYQEFLLGTDEAGQAYKVLKCRLQGKYAVLFLSGIDDRNKSEECIGKKIWVLKESLPELGDDEFYWHEMEGLEVFTDDGRRLGLVKTLFATGGSDVLLVEENGREYLIPAVDEIILSRDIEAGKLIIKPLPGLLEINESDDS